MSIAESLNDYIFTIISHRLARCVKKFDDLIFLLSENENSK